jgi:arsenite methyltransferase
LETANETLKSVQDYYGKFLKSKADLQTTACCTAEALPVYLREYVREIHPEVQDKFYGCGSPIPPALEGLTVLDLGCGSGRDSYLLSRLVGPRGRVIGVDMTDEQLATARKHLKFHQEKYGYQESNVDFRQGYIEDLKSIGIESNSIDLIVSNCVINLSPEKERVFSEAFRVLKPGGELYFSDVFADRRIPKEVAADAEVLGECLGGAMYIQDFRRMLSRLGCQDYRIFSSSKLDILNPEIEKKTGAIGFHSMTVRAFKIDIEDRCEDYGQVAYYLGTIPDHPNQFALDDHHLLEKNKPLLVCSNTAAMLSQTRFKKHFRIEGNLLTHFGLFDCAPAGGPVLASTTPGACC